LEGRHIRKKGSGIRRKGHSTWRFVQEGKGVKKYRKKKI